MNTSPIDSYEEAVEIGAYFTWANNEFMIIAMTVLGFAFSIWAIVTFVSMEKKNLESAAARLSERYSGGNNVEAD